MEFDEIEETGFSCKELTISAAFFYPLRGIGNAWAQLKQHPHLMQLRPALETLFLSCDIFLVLLQPTNETDTTLHKRFLTLGNDPSGLCW